MGIDESRIDGGLGGTGSSEGGVDGERVDGSGAGSTETRLGDVDNRSGSTADRIAGSENVSGSSGKTPRGKREVKEESGGETKRIRKPRAKAGTISAGSSPAKEKITISVTDENISRLAARIAGFHDLADIALRTTPLLHLESDQAVELSKAILNVLEQYDLSADPKYMALGNLMIVSAMIYQPKVAMYREVQKIQKAAIVKANESNN